MTVQVWSVEEFLEKAEGHAAKEFDRPADAHSWVDAVRTVSRRAITRGDGVAVYENADLGHPDIGQWQIVSYGGQDSQLETRHPVRSELKPYVFIHGQDAVPNTLPDIGQRINWRYQLHAIVPSHAQLELADSASRVIHLDEEDAFDEPDDLWKHLEDKHHTDVTGLDDTDLERWRERHRVKLHRPGRPLNYPHTHELPHLVAQHGYTRENLEAVSLDQQAAEHERLHEDAQVNLGHSHVGEAFNDPRVPCCERDAADCDCTVTLVLPKPELLALRQAWRAGQHDDRIVGLVRDLFDGHDGDLQKLADI